MTRPLRAVFISPIAPAITGNGLAMRMGQFAEALSKIADLTIMIVPAAGETGFRLPRATAKSPIHSIEIHAPADTHFSLLSRLADPLARLEAFRSYGKPSLARRLSAPVLADIARRVEALRPDFVHVGRSFMLPCAEFLPQNAALTLDLDEDDLSSFASQARRARICGDDVSSGWLEQEGLACDSMIARWGGRFQKVFMASRAEGRQVALRHPGLRCEVIENSVEIPRRLPKRDDGATLLFVGALAYRPNAEGVLWFCREVLPRLRLRSGGPCRLIIAGAGGAAIAALANHPRIMALGPVPELASLYRRATIALAPLHSGGGTRIKLLEAAAHRTASVATDQAAEAMGWPCDTGGWQGRNALEFARRCEAALANPAERDRRAAKGLNWVTRHHSRARVVSQLARSFLRARDQMPATRRTEEISG